MGNYRLYRELGGTYHMTVQISKFHPDDSIHIQQFMANIIYEEYGYSLNPRWHNDILNLVETYYNDYNNSLYVAKVGGQIVGTAGICRGGIDVRSVPRTIRTKYPWNTTYRLQRVFVHRDYRHQGIATSLVKKCIQWGNRNRPYCKIVLDSQHAIDFWKAIGAKVIYDERSNGVGDDVYFSLG